MCQATHRTEGLIMSPLSVKVFACWMYIWFVYLKWSSSMKKWNRETMLWHWCWGREGHNFFNCFQSRSEVLYHGKISKNALNSQLNWTLGKLKYFKWHTLWFYLMSGSKVNKWSWGQQWRWVVVMRVQRCGLNLTWLSSVFQCTIPATRWHQGFVMAVK